MRIMKVWAKGNEEWWLLNGYEKIERTFPSTTRCEHLSFSEFDGWISEKVGIIISEHL